MTTSWTPIRYRDFYDVPRAVVFEWRGGLFFLECPFDPAADEYAQEYQLFELPLDLLGTLEGGSWDGLAARGQRIGSVAVTEVVFNPSRRALLDVGSLGGML